MKVRDLGDAITIECFGDTGRHNLHLVDRNLITRDVMSYKGGDACREEHEAQNDSVNQMGSRLRQKDSEYPIDEEVYQKQEQNHECDDDSVENKSLH